FTLVQQVGVAPDSDLRGPRSTAPQMAAHHNKDCDYQASNNNPHPKSRRIGLRASRSWNPWKIGAAYTGPMKRQRENDRSHNDDRTNKDRNAFLHSGMPPGFQNSLA
ncbi:MAG: hypothetical protein ACREP9_13710, partial [Candidatus Dormibacteraceae bacterium]